MFWNFCYPIESRESPILEFGIPRAVFEDSLENVKFNISGSDLFNFYVNSWKFSEALKRHYTSVYQEDNLHCGRISLFWKETLGNSGAEMYNRGRARLAVLRTKV